MDEKAWERGFDLDRNEEYSEEESSRSMENLIESLDKTTIIDASRHPRGLDLSDEESSEEEPSWSMENLIESLDKTSIIDASRHPRVIAKPISIKSRMSSAAKNAHARYHERMFPNSTDSYNQSQIVSLKEIKASPLFSSVALGIIDDAHNTEDFVRSRYGLLAKRSRAYGSNEADEHDPLQSLKDEISSKDNAVFLNLTTSWSTFICGSQGSGKTNTVAHMLEMSLLPSAFGEHSSPFAGIVFHYDKSSAFSSSPTCEAASLCGLGISVQILVSPSSLHHMEKAYGNLFDLPANVKKPVVKPLFFAENQLTLKRVKKFLAAGEGAMSLYMEVVCKIIEKMALEKKRAAGSDYAAFKAHIASEVLDEQQSRSLNTRLDLLERFIELSKDPGKAKSVAHRTKRVRIDAQESSIDDEDIWSLKPGSLTIVDLGCPHVDEDLACSLFKICLPLFLKNRDGIGCIVAVDEAQKLLTGTKAASILTASLLQVIRQPQHLATGLIIATREPSTSPQLLDLSSMTIVHRFTSIRWLEELGKHFAGFSSLDGPLSENFSHIAGLVSDLKDGEALLFCPSAVLDTEDEEGLSGVVKKVRKLGSRYIQMQVMRRRSADGAN